MALHRARPSKIVSSHWCHSDGIRTMATLRKRGDKWQVQVRRQGCPAVSRSFIRKADAEAWARQAEAEADRMGLPVDPKILRQTTLRALIERYRDSVVVTKRGKDIETIILNAILRQPFVELALLAVTPATFSSYRDTRLKTVKAATICRELGILQHMYEVAIKDWSLPLAANPLRAVRKPALAKGRDRRLEGPTELAALIDESANCRNKLIGPLFLFAIETGMRRGELVNARWNQVNIDHRTLHIPVTKNGHARTIPLSTTAIQILDHLPRIDDERIFPISVNAVKLAWRRLRERAGAEGLRFHDLRHEAVSSFFERGLNVPEVALISGHRDARMLFRYTHLKAEDIAAKLR